MPRREPWPRSTKSRAGVLFNPAEQVLAAIYLIASLAADLQVLLNYSVIRVKLASERNK